MKSFTEAAIECEATYGINYDREEEFFECPECGDPIYRCDWEQDLEDCWNLCPICEFDFIKGE